MTEYRDRVLAEIDERIAAEKGHTSAAMASLRKQVERIPLPAADKRRSPKNAGKD